MRAAVPDERLPGAARRDPRRARGRGRRRPERRAELERLITIALQSGRVRALYGPGGEQALLRLYRRLPAGIELAQSAAGGQRGARPALQGKALEQRALAAVGPGAFTLTLAAGGLSSNIRLDRQGARLASVEAYELPEKRYYMACLDLEGRDVLVVGGGPVALEKVEGCSTAAPA